MKKLLFILLLIPFWGKGQVITTFAGNGTTTSTGDGAAATAAGLYFPCGGTLDKFGNYYCAQTNAGFRVRKIDANSIITTVAGTGVSGSSSDGIPATAAKLKCPQAVAVDTFGNLYIADIWDNRVRKVDVITGIISTVAGNTIAGFGGDGGPASAAILNGPQDLCFDKMGNLYIADCANSRVRKINTSGIISTIVGTGYPLYGGDGGLADTTSILPPRSLCVDNEGNLYIADWHALVLKVNTAGIITTFAGNGISASGSDGVPATATSTVPARITIDGSGNLYICEYEYAKVRVVNSSGIITTAAGTGVAGFSGDNGPATLAQLDHPYGVVTDSCDNLFIADGYTNHVRKVIFYPSCSGATLDLNSQNIAQPVSIYPNPATTQLTIQSTNQPINQLTITNLLGQTVYTHEYNTEKVQIDVADLPKGMYLIRINGSEVRKFVKE